MAGLDRARIIPCAVLSDYATYDIERYEPMLVKHSKRTIRTPCKWCGRKDLYWMHDTNSAARQRDYCAECKVTGRFTLYETDETTPHRDRCAGRNGRADDQQPDRHESDGADVEPKVIEAAEAMEPQQQDANGTADALAAFQTLMGAMGPKIDTDTVRSMVKAELDAIVFPTRTVVERANGERYEPEGATHKALADVTTDILAGEHVLMVGPAGTGKSTIAEQAAESLGLAFYAISLSPMTPASQILGYMQAEGQYVRTLYRDAYEHGGVFHFDEFDNAHPSVLAVVNASLANGQMAFPDAMVKRHEDFRCVASANTYGRGPDRAYVGRQQIDAATLDRFAVETIEVDEALETELCRSTGLDSSQVDRVLRYVRKLRSNAEAKAMTVVVSPRASVGMCKLLSAGKSWESAVHSRVRRGLSDADWAKLTA